MKYPVADGEIVFNGSQDAPKFYLLGGYSQNFFQNAVNWIQEYDVLLDTWRVFPYFMDKPRSSFVASMWDSNLVYFGGTDDNSLQSIKIFAQNEPSVFDTNKTFNRKNASGNVVGNNLVIIGGTDERGKEVLPFIVNYDLTQKQRVASFTFLNYFDNTQDLMTAAVGNQIFIVGGLNNNTLTNTVNRYNIPDNKLTLMTQRIKSPRAGGCAVYNAMLNKIFVIGGYDELSSALSTVEIITINSDGTLKISNGPSLQYPRKYPMAVSYKDKIYVFGGFDKNNQVVAKVEVFSDTVTTGVPGSNIPGEFALMQNYPNPFNPSTKIKFDLPEGSDVKLRVYNVLGEEVATLINGILPAGQHEVKFDASNLASGIYIYRMRAGNFVQVKKMLLMK